MPVYKKMPRSKPKKTDEFVSFFDRLYHKAYSQGPAVIAILAIAAFVGLGYLFWQSRHQNQAEQLAERFYEASKKGVAEQEKIYSEIQRAEPYSSMGLWASLELANLKGECKQTLTQLKPYIGYGEDETLRTLIYLKMGTCLEEVKNWKDAEDLYERAASDSRNLLRDSSKLQLARVKLALDQKEESQKILKELSEEGSKVSPMIQEQARTLLGVEIPPRFLMSAPELTESAPTTQPETLPVHEE